VLSCLRALSVITLGMLLWLPILTSFFEAMSCTYSDSGKPAYLDVDPGMKCWTGAHNGFVVLAVFGILMFLPMALFTIPKFRLSLNEELQINWNPYFVLSTMGVELVLAATSTFLAHYPGVNVAAIFICSVFIMWSVRNSDGAKAHQAAEWSRFIRTLLMVMLLLCRFAVSRVTSRYPTGQLWRQGGAGFVLWISLCACITVGLDNPESAIPSILMFVGAAATLILLVLFQLGWIAAPQTANLKMIRALHPELDMTDMTARIEAEEKAKKEAKLAEKNKGLEDGRAEGSSEPGVEGASDAETTDVTSPGAGGGLAAKDGNAEAAMGASDDPEIVVQPGDVALQSMPPVQAVTPGVLRL
jgi:hypothetical protein